jgi:hypothetical protein
MFVTAKDDRIEGKNIPSLKARVLVYVKRMHLKYG